jgi:F-type H+-transporting ATPase subunit b
MDSLISTFHIDWKLIVAQMVNFAIVFAVLYWFALKPLAKLMKERGENIAKGLTDAKANADVLANTQKEYDAALATARREAGDIVTSAKKDATTEKDRILAEAKKTSDAMIASGKKELESEKEKMLADAKSDLAKLVMSATEKVLEGTVHGAVEASLVDKSIKDVSV